MHVKDIHHSIFCTHLIQCRVAVGLEPIPADRDKQDTQPCTLTLTPKDNLESPINLTLGGERKPEYPERTHAYTGRTCKLSEIHIAHNTIYDICDSFTLIKWRMPRGRWRVCRRFSHLSHLLLSSRYPSLQKISDLDLVLLKFIPKLRQ